MGARSRLKRVLWEQGASKVAVVERGAIREQIDFFQGSRENEKLQGSKREKMKGS